MGCGVRVHPGPFFSCEESEAGGMNREPGEGVATRLGLQGLEVGAVEWVQHRRRGRVRLVGAESRDARRKCAER